MTASTTDKFTHGAVDTAALIEAENQRLRNKMKPGRYLREIGWRHIIAVAAIAYSVFPILFVLSGALSPSGSMTTLFSQITMQNFEGLGRGCQQGCAPHFWTWFWNSLEIGLITGFGTVLMGAASAYAFSRFRFRGRRGGLTALLVIQMFPQMLAFVAVFLLVMSIDHVFGPAVGFNSKWMLIMVYLGGALGVNTFLMYGFFNTVPISLDEAAKIDGASHTQIYWTIILRMVTPILAVVGLLSFISSFGEFILASLILPSIPNTTLAVGLFSLVSQNFSQNWGIFAAGAVITAIPVLILFLLLQKYIVGGLTAGSVKG